MPPFQGLVKVVRDRNPGLPPGAIQITPLRGVPSRVPNRLQDRASVVEALDLRLLVSGAYTSASIALTQVRGRRKLVISLMEPGTYEDAAF